MSQSHGGGKGLEGGGGIWHKTSVQAAREQRLAAYPTTALAGQKRPSPGPGDHYPGRLIPLHQAHLGAPGPIRGLVRPQGSQHSKIEPSRVVDIDPSLVPGEYSQRKELAATPSSTVDPLLYLGNPIYGLPRPLVDNFLEMGIKQIYPWQKQCLLGPAILSGEKNLVYSAPTGGGKSLVADTLMMKTILKTPGAKALLVLPYVALVQEKVRWLRNAVRGLTRAKVLQKETPWRKRADEDAVRVVGFFGGNKIHSTWHDFDIAVCTLEKANGLVNTAIDEGVVSNLQSVVLDELHMVDDDHRGYILELLTTKLLSLDHHVQIIGMSATLSNIDLLARWLNAHSYETHYRPVPIREHLVHEGDVYPAGTTAQALKALCQGSGTRDGRTTTRQILPSQHKELQETVLNSVVALACETARAGYGALVFASSRSGCEADARIISRAMPRWEDAERCILDARTDLLNDLRSLSIGLDSILEHTIPAGVAFHPNLLMQAGLTTEERDLVANAYDAGTIKICVTTCSLAAGINLPARRVILHNARMGRDLVGPSMLRQMRGRAGRKGKDEVGETYLCCRTSDLEDVIDVMHAELPQISSGLTTENRRLQRAILEIVAIRLATSRESIDEYMQKTLLHHSGGSKISEEGIDLVLEDLEKLQYVTQGAFQTFDVTQLGKAIVASGLDPGDGQFVYKELKKALQAFVMDGEMHILYTFTPVNEMVASVNWQVFRNVMDELDDSSLRVLGLVGVKPAMINKLARGGTMRETTDEEKELARIYRRFYLALQLRDICNEMPVHVVAKKYDMPRGTVQTLAQTSQGFSAGMIKFCDIMGWGVLSAALDHFTDRLKAGAKADLLALAQITFVKSRTARVFYDNNFKTVAHIANAEPAELVPVLMQAQPNKLRLKDKDEEKYGEKLLAKAKVISESANMIWQLQLQQERQIEEE